MAKLARIPNIGLPFLLAGALVTSPAHLPAQTSAPAGPQEAGVVGIFSAVFLVGNALGSMVFGYVAHGLGYFAMWAMLTGLLAAGFGLSFRLREGYVVQVPRAV